MWPPKERNLELRLKRLAFNLSIIEFQVSCLLGFAPTRIPKKIKGISISLQFKQVANLHKTFCSTPSLSLLLKKFTLRSVTTSKHLKIAFNVRTFIKVGFPRKRVSSANWRIDKEKSPSPQGIPSKKILFHRFSHQVTKTLCHHDEKEEGYGIPLVETSFTLKFLRRTSIYQNRLISEFHATSNPLNPYFTKVYSIHNIVKKTPPNGPSPPNPLSIRFSDIFHTSINNSNFSHFKIQTLANYCRQKLMHDMKYALQFLKCEMFTWI